MRKSLRTRHHAGSLGALYRLTIDYRRSFQACERAQF
jgi:hypothetical protein